MKKVAIIGLAASFVSFACHAENNGGFNQNYYGQTKVCNASAPGGCKEAFVTNYNEYKKYLQNFGDGTVVCNSTANYGCQYNGIVYQAKQCLESTDGKIYCYQ